MTEAKMAARGSIDDAAVHAWCHETHGIVLAVFMHLRPGSPKHALFHGPLRGVSYRFIACASSCPWALEPALAYIIGSTPRGSPRVTAIDGRRAATRA